MSGFGNNPPSTPPPTLTLPPNFNPALPPDYYYETGIASYKKTHVFVYPLNYRIPNGLTSLHFSSSSIQPDSSLGLELSGNAWSVISATAKSSNATFTTSLDGLVTMATGPDVTFAYGWAQDQTRTGIVYPSASAMQSDPYYQRLVPAGDSWSDYYPDPTLEGMLPTPDVLVNYSDTLGVTNLPTAATELTTVGVSNEQFSANNAWSTRFRVGYKPMAGTGYIAAIGFPGPIQLSKDGTTQLNTGYYMLGLRSDGTAVVLQETTGYTSGGDIAPGVSWRTLNATTKTGAAFKWGSTMEAAGAAIALECTPVYSSSNKQSYQGKPVAKASIAFRFSSGDALGKAVNATDGSAVNKSSGGFINIDLGRCIDPSLNPTSPIWIDLEIGVRSRFTLYKKKYDVGIYTLQDKPFILSTPPLDTSQPIKVHTFYSQPAGTLITIDLYEAATGNVLTGVVDPTTNSTDFTILTPGVDTYYALFTFTSSSDDSPLLFGYHIDYSPTSEQHYPADQLPIDITDNVSIESIDIQMGGPDPESYSASIDITDPTGYLINTLGYSGEFDISIEVDTRSQDEASQTPYVQGTGTMLFRGMVESPTYRYTGRPAIANQTLGQPNPPSSPPSLADQITNLVGNSWKVTYNCVGEWATLRDTLSTNRVVFDIMSERTEDTDAPSTPWDVSDILFKLFSLAHVPNQAVDIPTFLQNSGIDDLLAAGDTDMVIEPYVSLGELIVHFIRNYYGGWLYFDPQALIPSSGQQGIPASAGMWRVMTPPNFNTVQPIGWFSQTQLPGMNDAGQMIGATQGTAWYPNNAGLPPGALVETYMLNNTFEISIVPPEANYIKVYSQSGGKVIAVTAQNFESYNFYPPVPTAVKGPDALARPKPAIVYAPAGTDPAGVDYYARRLYEYGCKGRLRVRFAAPLLFIPSKGDTYIADGTLRVPRYYDPVSYEGTLYWLRNMTIHYTKDSLLFATYEIEKALPDVLAT